MEGFVGSMGLVGDGASMVKKFARKRETLFVSQRVLFSHKRKNKRRCVVCGRKEGVWDFIAWGERIQLNLDSEM